jgi:hypothetical protein
MPRCQRQFSARRAGRYVFFAFALLASTLGAAGEDMPIENGRFAGEVTVIKLSKPQIALIEETQVLRLTPAQRNQLSSEAGLAPTEFCVCDTRRLEFSCASAKWNVALRFSDRAVEIPHEYLVPDEEAMRRRMALKSDD